DTEDHRAARAWRGQLDDAHAVARFDVVVEGEPHPLDVELLARVDVARRQRHELEAHVHDGWLLRWTDGGPHPRPTWTSAHGDPDGAEQHPVFGAPDGGARGNAQGVRRVGADDAVGAHEDHVDLRRLATQAS